MEGKSVPSSTARKHSQTCKWARQIPRWLWLGLVFVIPPKSNLKVIIIVDISAEEVSCHVLKITYICLSYLCSITQIINTCHLFPWRFPYLPRMLKTLTEQFCLYNSCIGCMVCSVPICYICHWGKAVNAVNVCEIHNNLKLLLKACLKAWNIYEVTKCDLSFPFPSSHLSADEVYLIGRWICISLGSYL